MKIALRFGGALALCVALVVATQSWLQVQDLVEIQSTDHREDLQILTRALAAGAGELWRVEGEQVATRFVERADERRARVELEVRPLDAPIAHSGPIEPTLRELRDRERWRLEARAPIAANGQRYGELLVSRTRPSDATYLSRKLKKEAPLTLGMIAFAVITSLALGVFLIARPVEALRDHARSVAGGDYSLMKVPRRADELRGLAIELNTMTTSLAHAHAAVDTEREERTHTLQRLRHADRLATVGKLAARVAHEVGTPLNVITGRAELIAKRSKDEKVQRHTQIIVDQTAVISRGIRQLLDFARRRPVSKAKRELPSEIFTRVQALLVPVMRGSGVTLSHQADDDLPPLPVDGMMQVLTNLVMNATQAMPEGGRVEMVAEREGELLRVVVRDDGPGIAPSRQDEIFEPFITTKASGEGTGLGLDICRGIVEGMDGEMSVRSALGEGAEFIIELPIGDLS